MYGGNPNILKGVTIVLNESFPKDTVKQKDLHGCIVEVSRDVWDKLQKEISHDYRGFTINK